jgi:hypothetical protein
MRTFFANPSKNSLLPTAVAVFLVGLFIGCRKDKFESVAQPGESAPWSVSDTEFDQARSSLKTTQEINFLISVLLQKTTRT